MAIFLSPIDREIRETLDKRSKAHNFDFSDDISWEDYHLKTPWVSVYSNVEIGTIISNTEITYEYDSAQQHVLTAVYRKDNNALNGGFTDMYHANTLKSSPVLSKVNVRNKGRLGSLREATIDFTCYTYDDFEVMSKLYMSPGTSITLQWGWSTTEGLTELVDISEEDKSSIFDFSKMQDKIRTSKGHYDCLIGIVTNFAWDVQEDGSINCTCTLTAMGTAALDIEFDDCPKIRGLQRPPDEIFDKRSEIPEGCNLQTWITEDLPDWITEYQSGTLKEVTSDIWFFLNPWRKQGEDIVNKKTKIMKIGSMQDDKEIIISESGLYQFTGEGGDGWKNKWYISLNQLMSIITVFQSGAGSSFTCSNADGTPTMTHGFDNVFSGDFRMLDRRLSLLPKVFYEYKGSNKSQSEVMRTYYENRKGNWSVIPVGTIFVAVDEVIKAFKGASTVNAALNSILQSINTNSSNIFDLGIIVEDDGNVRIIDKKFIKPAIKSEDFYKFKIYNKNSIVRNFSLNSNLPDSMKATALYALNDDTSGNNEGLTTAFGTIRDRYVSWRNKSEASKTKEIKVKRELTQKEIKARQKQEQDDIEKLIKFLKKSERKINKFTIPDKYRSVIKSYWTGRYTNNGHTFVYTQNNGWKNITDSEITQANRLPSFIPIELSITIDGISGIYFGNGFTVDYLPANYKVSNNVVFQVIEVKHDIENGDWKTELVGQMRVI